MTATLSPSREVYRAELAELARHDKRILCLEADLGGQRHPFAEAHPDRFFNMGIAEAAMIDIAVSLASAGYRPFCSTFAGFAVLRAAESLKLGLGYLLAPVTVVAPYAGVAGGWFGTTHHCLEDLAVIQSIPGISLAAPFGMEETREVLRRSLSDNGPCFIRLGRNSGYLSLPALPSAQGVVWDQDGESEVCLISVGEKGTELCLQALSAQPELMHAHLCYLDQPALRRAASELQGRARRFIVVEEHRPGGSVASSLALMLPDQHVTGFNAGETWPCRGGNHDDVLSELGFALDGLLSAIRASVVNQ